ncbi:soyasapogenol B glucuronide galactosyltransferase-like [Lotus japonicus]|uniref:Glycosyltransferase n=1 Tax=Lotus japonicus TaxID=34305 RepID=A0A6S6QMP8_LOTJA|nr:soyasapogenol B glucuronide galactosyltransferase-like [Lotus japonicus]BCJ78477.1 UDP-glycosyltransferase 73P14 [Lotus japonicus]
METTIDVGEAEMLKAVFLPFPITSHTIRVVDTARLFAMHGVDVTIITTPGNTKVFQTSIDHCDSGHIRIHLVNFPGIPGLPQGFETFTAHTPQHLVPQIFEGISLLQDPIQQLFATMKPDFIVSDMFFPWSADAAAELGIPHLIYLGGSYISRSARNSIEQYAPHTKVDSDSEPFLLPGLPHKLHMTRLQLPAQTRERNHLTELMKTVKESEKKSYGSLINSFYEFEGIYEEHYKTTTGTKSWSVGPVSLWVNQDESDKDVRGGASEEREPEGWLTWLDSKTEDSVLYVCFGSMNKFSTSQLVEIAHALEDFGHDFIWVVGKFEDQGEIGGVNGFLKEFENRVVVKSRGYLIRGWAPQLLILDHPAIGGVVTHCGWNTTLESVIAGLPMATMPLFAEQFYNEKLLVDVLGIGVSIGVKKWKKWNEVGDEIVKRENIVKAISLLMGGGEEALEMRRRARVLGEAAKKTIQPGGCSHTKVKGLIDELKALKLQKFNHKIA